MKRAGMAGILLALAVCGSALGKGENVWSYTTEKPAGTWFAAEFDASGWKRGAPAFGRGAPGMEIRTKWDTSEIWLRRTLDVRIPAAVTPVVRMIHDEDVVVYLNGVEACRAEGYITAYRDFELAPAALAALKPGTNVLAAHCKQTSGGQGIDLDLSFDTSLRVLPGAVAFVTMVVGRPLKDSEKATTLTLWNALERADELLADWLRQDLGAPYGVELFADGACAATLRRAAERALAQTAAAGGGAWKAAQVPAGDDAAVLAFYRKVCAARRAQRLARAASDMPRLVYARHFVMGGSHYAYTEALSDAQAERNFRAGAKLCLAEAQPDGLWKETELLDSPEGVIRDVDVDYDGKKILFSWKKSDRGDDYHLYEMDAGTRAIRQLTEGLGAADYEGCYLPDGNILFNSTRCMQIVDCWWTEVSNLYRCDKDGNEMLRLTFDQVHLNYPSITWDGRILYTRWEYNDRSQMYPQPLFQMWPDGVAQTAVYGENSWFPTTIIHARGIPSSGNIFAIATGHHSRQPGELILIEPAKGRQEAEGVTRVAPVRETKPVVVDAYGQENDLFAYPYPLDGTSLLVTYNPIGWNRRFAKREENRMTGFGVYWMDIDGRREMLASRLGIACGRAVPLRPRARPPARPQAVRYGQPDGTFYVQDVYEGEAMAGVPRGTVKTLRVVELDYRTAGIGNNGNGGPGGGAMISTPVSIGNGAWDPKILVGDAKVHEDGSAFFTTDARRPVYFMLLDAKGRTVQTMRSWTTLQPGENASCVGCHESKNSVPLASARPTKALAAGAQALAPIRGPRRGFSFVKEVQPVLDKHCVSCHGGKDGKKPDLTGAAVLDPGAKRNWTKSYLALTHARPDGKEDASRWRGDPTKPLLNWVSAASAPPLQKPYSAGANTSALFKKLDEGHAKTITPDEVALLALWVDLGVPFCGDYAEAGAWDDEERAKYAKYQAKRERFAADDLAALKALAAKQGK